MPGRGERRLVVAGQDERLAGGRGEGEAVLDLADPGEILRVRCIDQDPGRQRHIRGVELVHGQRVVAGLGEDPVDVMILVDDHHRQVPAAGVGHGHRRPVRDVDDRDAVQRVAVHPDDRLLIERGGARRCFHVFTPPACA